jgi:hypothetical protein
MTVSSQLKTPLSISIARAAIVIRLVLAMLNLSTRVAGIEQSDCRVPRILISGGLSADMIQTSSGGTDNSLGDCPGPFEIWQAYSEAMASSRSPGRCVAMVLGPSW